MEKDVDVVAQKLDKIEGQKEEVVIVSDKPQHHHHHQVTATQQVLIHDEDKFSTEDLHGNDTKVLSLLNEEEGSSYSFKGIMRKLHIHQQSLARALHRLEEMGLVEKSQAGYRLSKVGETATLEAAAKARGSGSNSIIAAMPKGREYMQLLQTYIPLDIRPAEIVRTLVGRWFRNLRWVSLIESGTGFTLQWASDDGSFQINLRMVSEYVIFETNAKSEREKLQAMVGSYAIYEQITKILQGRLAPAQAYLLGLQALQNN